MTWLKLSDDFADECAEAGLSDAAFRTHVEGLLWTMRRESGGRLTPRDVKRFAETDDPDAAVAELAGVGFWADTTGVIAVVHHMDQQVEPRVLAQRRKLATERQRSVRYRKAGLSPELSAVVAVPLPAVPTGLYRWYDEDDAFLYAGITNNVGKRQDAHIADSSWTEFATRSTVERFLSRPDAERAEVAAIKSEHPLFNRQHNDTPEARQRLADYLLSKGRPDLLTPAALATLA